MKDEDLTELSQQDASPARERSALVIFIVLVVLGILVFVLYFSTGRSWSVAATAFDDTMGSMDAYSAIVFSGIADPKKTTKDGEEVDRSRTLDSPFPESDDSQLPHWILSEFQLALLRQKANAETVFASDVREVYETKGASVATINLADPMRYKEPVILDTGEKRIGVFYIDAYVSRAQLRSIEEALRKEGADDVICIASRPAMLSTGSMLDVVIFLDDIDVADIDLTGMNETLVIVAPPLGNVGVVLFSSNNVASYKLIEEL